jgi:putative SOS response-associated peptidase YedK
MCGRYVSVQADSDLLAEFEAIDATDNTAAAAGPLVAAATGYNVAPTDPVRAIVNRRLRDENGRSTGDPVRQLRVLAWGLVPSWSKDRSGAARMINARSESVASKPAFKRAFASRRCLIPADGWYEWRKGATTKDPKQPFFMTPRDGHGLAFAGLYEFWSDPAVPDAPTLTSCAIITVPSAGQLETIHDRMPLVLPAGSWARWLDPGVTDPTDLVGPWDEAAGEHLELRPVSTQVNSVRNDGPELIERVEAGADEPVPARLF